MKLFNITFAIVALSVPGIEKGKKRRLGVIIWPGYLFPVKRISISVLRLLRLRMHVFSLLKVNLGPVSQYFIESVAKS
jgi:hypothetical protein